MTIFYGNRTDRSIHPRILTEEDLPRHPDASYVTRRGLPAVVFSTGMRVTGGGQGDTLRDGENTYHVDYSQSYVAYTSLGDYLKMYGSLEDYNVGTLDERTIADVDVPPPPPPVAAELPPYLKNPVRAAENALLEQCMRDDVSALIRSRYPLTIEVSVRSGKNKKWKSVGILRITHGVVDASGVDQTHTGNYIPEFERLFRGDS